MEKQVVVHLKKRTLKNKMRFVAQALESEIRGKCNYANLIALNLALMTAIDDIPEWQPIETAPKDGTSLLLHCGSDGIKEGWFETGKEFSKPFNDWTDGWTTVSSYDAGYNRLGPTLWMPLPDTPEEL